MMPILIKSIDQIARQKQRDVLFIRFDTHFIEDFDYKKWTFRQNLIHWLMAENIPFEECADIAKDEEDMNAYLGQLYIDIPYQPQDPIYQKLANHLENSEGKMKIDGVLFCLLPLHIAMKNAHHDDIHDNEFYE